jgi:hypothetical protein
MRVKQETKTVTIKTTDKNDDESKNHVRIEENITA